MTLAGALCYALAMMTRFRMMSALLVGGLFVSMLSGCMGLHTGHMFAVPGPDARPLDKSKGVATAKEGVVVVAAAQNEVKEADAFYFIVYNQTGQYLNFDQSEIRLLDHNGKEYKPLSRSQKNFLLGARYKPKPPIGMAEDTFRLDRSVAQYGDTQISPLDPGEVFKWKVMPGSRAAFFAYFHKRSVDSPYITVILPNLEKGASKEKLTFLFRFEVQEK